MKNITLLIFWVGLSTLNAQLYHGTILNIESKPIVGANVYWSGESYGVISDQNGYFRIRSLGKSTEKLVISYLGYRTRELNIEPDTPLDLGTIILHEISVNIPLLTVSALHVREGQPFAFQNIEEEDLERRNLGKDIPSLLQYSPSIVTTSDAGNGIGYTGLRIRGSDQSRINVTINGIPYNDAESQQVFWVDLPDFSSSLNSMQIQRGLGTSTNGSGAFGASIHLNTFDFHEEPFAEISNSFGSYSTRRHNVEFGTGRIDDRLSFNGKLALIKSDGYIDRASADLKSYYLNANYTMEKGSLHAMVFSGSEITYQAWYGTPESRLENDREGMLIHASNNGLTEEQTQNLLNSGRTYNFYTYDNQVDDYKQDHYQLHFFHQLGEGWDLKTSLHMTRGQGFFEEYREEESFSDYGLENPEFNGQPIFQTDLIRRRWLDNYFYGVVWEAERSHDFSRINIGGGFHRYIGDHFGEIIWSEIAVNQRIRERYYFNEGKKNDFNIYGKYSYTDFLRLDWYLDLQLRKVDYRINGKDNDLRSLLTDIDYIFFNPKLGVSYPLFESGRMYASYGIGNREPDRNDFVDTEGISPDHETLRDLEFGFKYRNNSAIDVNFYWMDYSNQLVLTGELNDVGAPLRTNVPDSYRLGMELVWGVPIPAGFYWSGSLNLSQNRINQFTEVIYDYTSGLDIVENLHEDTPISFSPEFIGTNSVAYEWRQDSYIRLNSKYVGNQYLDNTGNESRTIDSYFIHDLSFDYQANLQNGPEFLLSLSIYNLFNELYSANGYTFSYVFGELITENFYYPQAERNFMLGLTVKI